MSEPPNYVPYEPTDPFADIPTAAELRDRSRQLIGELERETARQEGILFRYEKALKRLQAGLIANNPPLRQTRAEMLKTVEEALA